MKNNSSLAYSVLTLVIGDFVALAAAFVVAYILRVSLSNVPISSDVQALTYFNIIVSILPLWIIIFALLGLYTNRVHENRFNEIWRLFAGSVIGVMSVISYAYLAHVTIFPARLVVLYGLLLTFVFVFIFRTLARGTRRVMFRRGLGVNRVLVIGDTKLSGNFGNRYGSRQPHGRCSRCRRRRHRSMRWIRAPRVATICPVRRRRQGAGRQPARYHHSDRTLPWQRAQQHHFGLRPAAPHRLPVCAGQQRAVCG